MVEVKIAKVERCDKIYNDMNKKSGCLRRQILKNYKHSNYLSRESWWNRMSYINEKWWECGWHKVYHNGSNHSTACSLYTRPWATLIPFTSATGKAVSWVVIFKSDKIKPEGYKKPSRESKGKINIVVNPGQGNYFSAEPSCEYNEKQIDYLTFTSECCGITANILIKILKYFDVQEVLPWVPCGPIPMLHIDGRQLKLDTTLIDFINENGQCWKVCLGFPHATTSWQVDNSAGKKGTVKVDFYHARKELLVWAYERGLTQSIDATDIITLLNIALPIAFGKVDCNFMHCC